jgi:hypothetical protein
MANRPDDRLPESVVVVTNLNEDCSADASLTRHIKGRGSPVRAFMETHLLIPASVHFDFVLI